MAIRWRQNDLKKLSTYVRKFNAAITRLEKNAPDLKGLGVFPERLYADELKARIMNRNDFNREMRKIDRFFKKGARDIVRDEAGFETTRWQKRELKYTEMRINAQNRAYIKKYNIPKNQIEFLGLKPVDLMKEKKKIFTEAGKLDSYEQQINKLQEWYNIAYTLDRESSADYLNEAFARLRSAYFNAINAHMPPERAEELINFLKDNDIWGSDIVWAISQNDILDFEYFYSTDDEERRAEVMLDRWKGMLPKLQKQPFYQEKKRKVSRKS